MQTPFAKYNCNYAFTQPRVYELKYQKPTSDSSWRIPKKDEPGPGSY